MAFDTERAARRLADAGMEERAANGVADVMADATDGLATEASVRDLQAATEASVRNLQAATEASVRDLQAATEASLLRLEGRMEAGFAEMRAEMAESRAENAEFRADIYRALWIQGLGILAGTAAIVTIISALD